MNTHDLLLFGLALALFVPRSSSAAEGSGNLLRNGTFIDGINGWNFSEGALPCFELSDDAPQGVAGRVLNYRNEREAMRGDFSFHQVIHFKADVYYRLTFRYRGDGRLAPMVLLNEEGKQQGVSRRMFRLKAGTDWQTYQVEFCMGGTDEDFRLQFYPGSAPHFYTKGNGTPVGNRTGEFSFADIRLVEIARRDGATPKGPFEVRTERVVYKKTDDVELALLVDIPKSPKAPVPVMVMIHGGGWVTGTPESMAWRSMFLAERGIAVVRIQYRLIKQGGTFPKTMSDVMDAIEWVRANSVKMDFDLSRFGLTGGSAGGHLSAIAAQRTPECNVYLGFCGLYDADQVGEGRFARKADGFLGSTAEDRRNGSAIHQIKDHPPATILFHGTADPTIDFEQAVRFAEALRQRGARVELVLNEGCGHEVGELEKVNRHILTFLNREWNMEMRF